jgi:hypothetical protein
VLCIVHVLNPWLTCTAPVPAVTPDRSMTATFNGTRQPPTASETSCHTRTC